MLFHHQTKRLSMKRLKTMKKELPTFCSVPTAAYAKRAGYPWLHAFDQQTNWVATHSEGWQSLGATMTPQWMTSVVNERRKRASRVSHSGI